MKRIWRGPRSRARSAKARRNSKHGRIVDALTVFGLVAVSLMLVCYALEDRGAGYILAFSWACLLASAYGFFQGAWPFGVIEAVWAGIAARRWYLRRTPAAGRVNELLLP